MIPKVFHFIFLTHSIESELDVISYVAIKSCIVINRPESVILHCNFLPSGKYWESLKDHITVNCVEIPTQIYGNSIVKLAHAADVIRLNKLLECGGVYLDLDTICVRPFPEYWYSHECVMGLEKRPTFSFSNYFRQIGLLILKGKLRTVAYQIKRFRSEKYVGLCNAVILSEKNSIFIKEWLNEYHNFDQSQWNYHSVIYPLKLSSKKKFRNTILKLNHRAFFYPSYDEKGIRKLFVDDANFGEEYKGSYLHHLWLSEAKKYIDIPTEEDILRGTDYYSEIAKVYLNL